ncbi:type I polyketide synthase [Actinoalloteichus caeruleus]|uniref:type I polyketide synthase n=1 Tax=Actinoalloteichus cyanogriseus TaxID=2893586 RepID=UPI003BB84CDD
MNSARIAVVGIGLRYPDAESPDDLWANVLAGRRAFRPLPDERMNRADYWSPDPAAPDRFYATKAAVLRDFEFDRVAHKVAGSTYRVTDLTHWLALDVATHALRDAGYPDGAGLPSATTGVVIGNSLTGEFTRAGMMRLRWPYVRRTLAAALTDRGWDDQEISRFLLDLEPRYKAPFPPVDEDSLAGGLSNTIAGRICNHFDLGGGGYTVDGACSSSLLSVATAATALAEGDLDVALAGGVDLSIDPFEVIGFAKTGALATSEMKVYDRDSNGFWPGEGCGLLVLMREADALAEGRRIYATLAGWGISSDGRGGITRPEATGHRRALTRAYDRAGYGLGTVSYFEGHGTGTALGDATEIDALSSARREAAPEARPAALSSVKANIGHTKAAAGVAGLIKAVLAVHHQVIPPATGHHAPHPGLRAPDAAVYVPDQAEPWPVDQPVRTGVSAMGFGGINTHIAVDQPPGVTRRHTLDDRTRSAVASRQDAELLLLDAEDRASLRSRVAELVTIVHRLAYAELADLAAVLADELAGRPTRAAIVAGTPEEAARRLERLLTALDGDEVPFLSPAEGVFLADRGNTPHIVYLFPGQGSGRAAAGALRRRFPAARTPFETARERTGDAGELDATATENAQPRIVAGSLAALTVLRALGVDADTAVGHSLGELTALHWAGALDDHQVSALASARGRVMAAASRGGGGMAGLTAGPAEVGRLIRLATDEATDPHAAAEARDVVIAGYNGPRQTVISGPAPAVDRVCDAARAAGIDATRLAVSHAFHSPLVAPAAEAMTDHLATVDFAPPHRRVISSVTGEELDRDVDPRDLLRDQITHPVRFDRAAATAAQGADLVVEVGPGRVLTRLLGDIAPEVPALAVDTDSPSLAPLLSVVAAAFALGVDVRAAALFEDRVIRPIPRDGSMTFLANPCETAPDLDTGLVGTTASPSPGGPPPAVAPEPAPTTTASTATPADVPSQADAPTLEVLRRLAADRAELPPDTIDAATHPLDDLHLSSITVGQIVNEAVRELRRPPLAATPNFATVRLGELADLIDDLAATSRDDDHQTGEAAGVGPWVRAFALRHVPEPRPAAPAPPAAPTATNWAVHAPPGHRLAEPLRAALSAAGLGDGVLLALPGEGGEDQVGRILAAGRAAATAAPGTRFVVVQRDLGASGLAKTVHLEARTPTTVVELPDVEPDDPHDLARTVDRVVGEVAATTAYTEVRYDAHGVRTVPVLTARVPTAPTATTTAPLDATDVLVVTGGGKGITAECALAITRDTGAAALLLGRSDPGEDPELAANLERLGVEGVRYRYERADVTRPDQVAAAIARAEAEFGPVTAVLHGAGRNEPTALTGLTEGHFRRTLAPKIDGLRAVLSSVDTNRLRLLVTFGSIIGRTGLRGEAHYATANDWLTELTLRFHRDHPHTRTVALEWSVWSGAGMGERLGVIESLLREGITPIPAEEGVAALRGILADPEGPAALVVAGRTAGLPTLGTPRQEPPLLRFVERVLVHYEGVELVTEARLSVGADPYLADHLLDGDLLFPAVMGMEAMSQVASVLTGRPDAPVLTDVEFLRPVVVRPGGSTTIRLAALLVEDGTVDVVLRSEETGFGADHFRARLRVPRTRELPDPGTEPTDHLLTAVPVDPATEMYGNLLFQGGRFRRLLRYRRAAARHVVAELSVDASTAWFGDFVPAPLLMADPGTRDAAMHALQCCVPDATLLPRGVERLWSAARVDDPPEYLVLEARERHQDGDDHTYDICLRDPAGVLVERWDGLTLRAVRRRDGAGPWPPALLGPQLERALEPVLGGRRSVVVEPQAGTFPTGQDTGARPGAEESGPGEADRAGAVARRRAGTAAAADRALGRPARLRHRPDGRPEVDGAELSAAHGAGLTLVVAGPAARPGCDVEPVVERTDAEWADLLGPALTPVRDLLRAETGESTSAASTRVWCALECARKAGVARVDLTVDHVRPDGWAVLASGDIRIATWMTTVTDRPTPVVFAVLAWKER